jgi:hypothetical protein
MSVIEFESGELHPLAHSCMALTGSETVSFLFCTKVYYYHILLWDSEIARLSFSVCKARIVPDVGGFHKISSPLEYICNWCNFFFF